MSHVLADSLKTKNKYDLDSYSFLPNTCQRNRVEYITNHTDKLNHQAYLILSEI